MVVNLQQFSFTPQGTDQVLLGPLDLQLASGEWLTVLGGNGSGKSTLAQLLSGWLPDVLSGKIQGKGEVLATPLGEGSLAVLSAQRQLVQQSPQLQLSGCTFSVEQEVAFGPENLGLPAEQIEQNVENALGWADCQSLRTRHPATLSGGEAQRVVIASALAMRPKLLLLDEAFSRLTPSATHRMLQQLKQYSEQSGCSLILFERSLLPAISFCDRLLLLEAGKIQKEGSLQQVFAPALASINAPDAWRALGYLLNQDRWKYDIPYNDQQLLEAFKRFYATAQ